MCIRENSVFSRQLNSLRDATWHQRASITFKHHLAGASGGIQASVPPPPPKDFPPGGASAAVEQSGRFGRQRTHTYAHRRKAVESEENASLLTEPVGGGGDVCVCVWFWLQGRLKKKKRKSKAG